MKIRSLILATSIALSPTFALATDVEIGVFADYIKSNTAKDSLNDWKFMEAGHSFGLDVTKVLNKNWDLRAEYAFTKFDTYNGNKTKNTNRIGFDGLYKFDDSNVYLLAGYKYFDTAKEYDALNVGAGYKYRINDKFSWFTEANIYKDINYGFIDQGIKIGLTYRFGDQSKALAPVKEEVNQPVKELVVAPVAPKAAVAVELDTDGDDVFDKNDKCADTNIKHVVDDEGCTVFEEVVESAQLNVTFENNSAEVKNIDMDQIDKLVNFLNSHTELDATIEGHASLVGNKEYNKKLSQKRANAVKSILVNDQNIAEKRITAVGYGVSQPLSTENSPAAHKMNRRVVVSINTHKLMPKLK